MKILEEFKAFAMRGNVVDMAVGVIIGGSFGKIVTSLVNDLIMPPIGRLLGGVDFSELYINLSEDNSFLDDQGFTVFGQVVDGTNVVDDIAAMETVASPIIPGEVSLPAEDVIMQRVSRLDR